MIVFDPNVGNSQIAKSWEEMGFGVLSVFSLASLQKVMSDDNDLVIPDFFESVPYDYKVKNDEMVRSSFISGANSDTPDYADETWMTREDAQAAIRRIKGKDDYTPDDGSNQDTSEEESREEPEFDKDDSESLPAFLDRARKLAANM